MDAFQNALSTVTGNVEKAKIKIRDDRGRKTAELKLKDMEKQKTSAGLGIGGIDVGDALADAVDSVADAAKNAIEAATGLNLDTTYNREMTVQFNPSSLHISSRGGDEVQITNFNRNNNGISRGMVNNHIEMSVKLIFDQVSNSGAFVQDMMTVSSSRVIKSATDAIADFLFGTSTQSVQMIVESFVATMRDENTRRICFEWGEFYYEGILNNVTTAYTMFDISGNPVRAEVTLTLYLVDDDIDKDFDEYWYDAYYAAFIEGNPTAMAMMAAAKASKALGL